MRFDLIPPGSNFQEIPALEFLVKIVMNNWGKIVEKPIRVPLHILKLQCGCTREYGTPLWRVSLVDASGAPLPDSHVRHELAGAIICNKIFPVQTHPSIDGQLIEVARKEQSLMLSPFDTVDELASSGKLGPDIASVMIGDGFEPEDVVNALREHRYEVHTQLGNEVHLRGVSDYPRGHVKYSPLQRRGTGDLVSAAVGNVTVDVEKPESPYHAKSEYLDPLPPAISWPNPRR